MLMQVVLGLGFENNWWEGFLSPSQSRLSFIKSHFAQTLPGPPKSGHHQRLTASYPWPLVVPSKVPLSSSCESFVVVWWGCPYHTRGEATDFGQLFAKDIFCYNCCLTWKLAWCSYGGKVEVFCKWLPSTQCKEYLNQDPRAIMHGEWPVRGGGPQADMAGSVESAESSLCAWQRLLWVLIMIVFKYSVAFLFQTPFVFN